VEIGVPEETPIQAAAAGQVTYSGDGIRGYGNLIIIRHDDSFFTVYGFNRKNLVASGAFVNQGEKIALSGCPPSGGKPRLHFEIRQGKAPVNPIFYLP
jgi:lipoprotein NlpD